VIPAYITLTSAEAVEGSKPVTYETYLLPEYFRFYVYIADTDGKALPKGSVLGKDFPAWCIEQLIRVRPKEVLEVIETTLRGVNTKVKGHAVLVMVRSEEHNPLHHKNYLPVKPIYYRIAHEQRSHLMGYAITTAVQLLKAVEREDGSITWPIFQRNDLSGEELRRLAKKAIDASYTKLTEDHYETIARIYNEAVADGLSPNAVLMERTGRSLKTVQSWTTEARKREIKLATPKHNPTKKGEAGK
jgi:hypothetical protein